MLASFFQMTVTDVFNVKTPIISIPKGVSMDLQRMPKV